MADFYENQEQEEKVLLIGVSTQDEDMEASLDELGELADTAGAVVLGRVIQNREAAHPGTYIGKGKIEEVRLLAEELGADGVICDDELSPAQLHGLEKELELKVMDRTLVILDIFAKHATTREGKLQVEMAQLGYRLARLSGLGKSLSRLGGGIGTRGPGEKKLETDRRLIKSRLARLNRELKQMQLHRDTARKQRLERAVPVAAVVGYTNAGKSTLMNALTGAGILAQDKLFATLDPTTRRMKLPGGQELLLTDTVGFIRKLPHHLVEAFKSTLEEARYADFILHVVDSSSPQMDAQMETVYETLQALDITGKPVITLFNKRDLTEGAELPKDLKASRTLGISAATGEGLLKLQELLEDYLRESRVLVEKVYPYAQAGDIARIRRYAQILEEEYREDGIYVRYYASRNLTACPV
ncbi:GTPase HflX [Lachnoclostridium sp. An138]|uniref:GTPase HflX n=1 Tax=Lachnoclostridium sp. An138 TaxID=1965560 RepID=UPI000B3A6CD5|nr:GTPase HflX [Lachnoclostridium sp. An138]OUQ17511.1 GTPase HflX [Lachnoclostridium sp. An138]